MVFWSKVTPGPGPTWQLLSLLGPQLSEGEAVLVRARDLTRCPTRIVTAAPLTGGGFVPQDV